MCNTYHCDYLPHTTFCFYLIDFQLNTYKQCYLLKWFESLNRHEDSTPPQKKAHSAPQCMRLVLLHEMYLCATQRNITCKAYLTPEPLFYFCPINMYNFVQKCSEIVGLGLSFMVLAWIRNSNEKKKIKIKLFTIYIKVVRVVCVPSPHKHCIHS